MNKLTFISRLTTFFLSLNLLILTLPSLVVSAQETDLPIFEEFPFPTSLRLFDEPMPLENRYVWEMLDREITISVWDRAQVFMWLKRSGRYFPYIEKALAEAGMPEDIKYVAVAESSLLENIRSSKGAIGVWQFMAHTGRHNGLRKDRNMDERRSFEKSTKAAIKHLKHLKKRFGNWTLTLAAYNLGETGLKREIKAQKVRDYYKLNLPLETERFIFRIAAIKVILENPKRYGYRVAPERIYRPRKCDTVQVRIRIPLHITDIAKALDTDFKLLKELNPEILGYYLPSGRYMIKVPVGLGPGITAVVKQLTSARSHRDKKISGDYYLVQPGDTLIHIAKRTGVSVATLKRLNGIRGSLIIVGQKLRLTP
ncbi:MAG: transglycosylase SLT domain-containing protein [Deltaproteobacteria bacterium]|nr:transglycosylase SLT domain-containing protein [Deltaproteobacteria bacterium]